MRCPRCQVESAPRRGRCARCGAPWETVAAEAAPGLDVALDLGRDPAPTPVPLELAPDAPVAPVALDLAGESPPDLPGRRARAAGRPRAPGAGPALDESPDGSPFELGPLAEPSVLGGAPAPAAAEPEFTLGAPAPFASAPEPTLEPSALAQDPAADRPPLPLGFAPPMEAAGAPVPRRRARPALSGGRRPFAGGVLARGVVRRTATFAQPPPAGAPPWRRAAAFAVDLATVALFAAPPLAVAAGIGGGARALGAVLPQGVAFVAAVAFAYATLAHALVGATAGKRLLGLRVVGPDGRRPGLGRSALRAAVAVAGTAALAIGPAAALFTRGRRALHDLASETRVLEAAGGAEVAGEATPAGGLACATSAP